MNANSTPIVVALHQLYAMPMLKVPPSLLKAASACHSSAKSSVLPPVWRLLECFLQITGLSFRGHAFSPIAFERVIKPFIGALYSKKFIVKNEKQIYIYIKELEKIYSEKKFIFPKIHFNKLSTEVEKLLAQFEKMPLDSWQCYLWRGWPLTNNKGKITWAPMYPIAISLGQIFTDKLYTILSNHALTTRAFGVRSLNDFLKFLGNRKEITPSKLLSPVYMKTFWNDFWIYYKTANANNSNESTIIINWIRWRSFVKQHLIPAEIVAPFLGESMPGPKNNKLLASRGDGKGSNNVVSRLLVEVPLSTTDNQAWKLLFSTVPESLENIERWATIFADDLFNRSTQRIAMAPFGKVTIASTQAGLSTGREWAVSRSNPNHTANAAATYEQNGHQPQKANRLYPLPAAQTAYELGLPQSYSLLPHATLITLSNASITPAFLEDLELYDKNGKMIGFSTQDNVSYLVGYKRRKGQKRAAQRIKLTEDAKRRVEQIISITAPLRKYLRDRGENNWKKLFIESGKGFGTPKNCNLSTSSFHIKKNRRLEKEIIKSGVEESKAKILAEYFSLTNVRHTMAVKVFADSHSEEEAAKALGHTDYREDLLKRYIPEPVLFFWKERWSRAFQNGILILAIKDDSQRLLATDFSDKRELDKFMTTDGYKLLEKVFHNTDLDKTLNFKHQVEKKRNVVTGRFVFNANIDNILAILSIIHGHTGNTLESEKKFWIEFASHIYKNLRERMHIDPTLMDLMELAERQFKNET